MKLNNRVAIVTGAGRGIGREVAMKFATEGANVVVTDIDEELCNETSQMIKENGGESIAVASDVSNNEAVERVVKLSIDTYGRIDILVNNAGVVFDSRIGEMEESAWDSVIAVNLKGSFLFSKHVSNYMIEQKYGKIVNISSRAHLGNPGQANYSAAKAGVVGLTKSLAKELGKFNITVNAVAPGLIETEALKTHPKYETIVKLQEKQTPIKRIGKMEDVANTILFFSSDDSSYITGDMLHVSGGRFG